MDQPISAITVRWSTPWTSSTVVPQTAHNVNEMLTVRSALGELETAGDATTILLNPSDWETIETTWDTQENFLLPLTPDAVSDQDPVGRAGNTRSGDARRASRRR